MLLLILTIVLILALAGSVPSWPHSRGWGYYPSGFIGLLLLVLLGLFFSGRLQLRCVPRGHSKRADQQPRAEDCWALGTWPSGWAPRNQRLCSRYSYNR